MKDLIVVGLGQAWTKFYKEVVAKMERLNKIRLLGTVDPAFAVNAKVELANDKWHVQTVQDIPKNLIKPETIVMILTPDHYSIIENLANMGFKYILCEKPLVSRRNEIEKLLNLTNLYDIRIYAIDFYLPKTLGLQVVRGLLTRNDPRYEHLDISHPEADFNMMLGEIEGVALQVIEAGSFCLPDIAGRPYLVQNREMGGMILDLITHVCGPLYQSRLLDDYRVLDVSLSRLSGITSGYLVPIADISTEVEIYITALLEANGIPVHLSFGKVPIAKGGIWALEIRGKNGMYYAGLRTGQPAILVSNSGDIVTFSLKTSTYEFVVREALLHFDGLLPGFDGNHGAFSTSMEVGRAIIGKYDESVS